MAFTHALYYPWIDISDSAWLKTAILYWEKISTIVPGYIEEPYESADSAFLKQLEILVPEYVESWQNAVLEASRNFLEYIRTPEAETILLPSGSKNLRIPPVERAVELAKLNKWKIGEELKRELIKSGRVIERDEWLIFDRQSIDYYMTLLAANIAHEKHLSPLTYDELFEPLANKAKRGDNPAIKKQYLGETLLAQMTLEIVHVASETPIESIIEFRNDYKDELGLLRSEIGRFANDIDPETPTFDALQQQIYDIYTNQISPAINNLEKALAGKRIRSYATHLSSFIFAGSLSYFEPNTPLNMAAYAGCEIIGNMINYMIDRKQELTNNPYSFILSAQSRLT